MIACHVLYLLINECVYIKDTSIEIDYCDEKKGVYEKWNLIVNDHLTF